MDYGEVFVKAGRLIWKHKILWLFGLFAGCASASSGNLGYRFDMGSFPNAQGQVPPQIQSWLQAIQQFIRQTPGWFFALALLLICGAGILFWLVGIYGRTGLARGAWLADSGEERLVFGTLSRDALRVYWKVVLASLLTGLPGFAVGLVFVLGLFFSVLSLFSDQLSGLGIGLICLGVPLFCILVPLLWLLGIWGDLTTVAIAGEGQGVMDGLKRGWRMLTRRFGSVLLFAVLLFFAQIAFGILLGLIFAPVGLSVVLSSVLLRGSYNMSLGLILLGVLILLPIALFLSALFHGYTGTIWTLVFRRLAATEIQPPLAPLAPSAPTPPPSDFPPPITPAA
jgi:hypothetical protein